MGRLIGELSRAGGEELQDFLNQTANAGLLFIDDLDKARFTSRVESELFDLLEYRETENMPVVITTNIKGRELEKMFFRNTGPAIVNRLRRMCIPIDFDAPGFDAQAALAAIQEKLRQDYVPVAEARRAFHLGEEPQNNSSHGNAAG
jgi:chromosomal replication initiation ATPase DnaA